jgi:hypothetical protein
LYVSVKNNVICRIFNDKEVVFTHFVDVAAQMGKEDFCSNESWSCVYHGIHFCMADEKTLFNYETNNLLLIKICQHILE